MTISGPNGGCRSNCTSKIDGVRHVEGPGGVSATKSGASRVEVSDSARQMSELSRLVREAPDVRTDLVNDIKQRLESGTYKIDLDQLAEKLSDVV